jgi:hypothetical protein
LSFGFHTRLFWFLRYHEQHKDEVRRRKRQERRAFKLHHRKQEALLNKSQHQLDELKAQRFGAFGSGNSPSGSPEEQLHAHLEASSGNNKKDPRFVNLMKIKTYLTDLKNDRRHHPHRKDEQSKMMISY